MYNIGVFISHSWAYTGHYDKLAEWLFHDSWDIDGTPLIFEDFSIPEDNPIHNAQNANQLYEAILGEMQKAHVIVCPTGMYATHSKWIGNEIAAVKQLGKRLVGVNPWDQERTSTVVAGAAHETVGWQKKSVASAIWRQYLESGT